jgi:hypothetical protein
MIASGADGSLGALAGYVYFTGQHGLQRVPRGGGQVGTLAGSNGDALAIDGANVYFTEITGGVNRYQTSDGTNHSIGNVPARAGGRSRSTRRTSTSTSLFRATRERAVS